eukprot:729058_1
MPLQDRSGPYNAESPRPSSKCNSSPLPTRSLADRATPLTPQSFIRQKKDVNSPRLKNLGFARRILRSHAREEKTAERVETVTRRRPAWRSFDAVRRKARTPNPRYRQAAKRTPHAPSSARYPTRRAAARSPAHLISSVSKVSEARRRARSGREPQSPKLPTRDRGFSFRRRKSSQDFTEDDEKCEESDSASTPEQRRKHKIHRRFWNFMQKVIPVGSCARDVDISPEADLTPAPVPVPNPARSFTMEV